MKIPSLIAALIALAGCASTSRDPALMKEREMTRRYTICMREQLGIFGDFASPESRRMASESCQKLIKPETPTANP